MKLNWFSPLPPQRTDIAHYTARIAAALMARFDVSFWSDIAVDRDALPPGADIQTFDPRHSEGHDFNGRLFGGLNVYNFGNDLRYHGGIAEVAVKIPGVAILHDTRLHHFVFERARNDEPPFHGYVELARRTYGPEGAAAAQASADVDGRTIHQILEAMPFIEPFVGDAIGVICHSEAASVDVRRRVATPILTLPLPFASLADEPRVSRKWSPPWRFAMFGYIDSNRRLESILRALASWPRAPPFRFDVYGSLWEPARIEALIARTGLQSRVTVHGFVPEQDLDQAIAAAHLVFNLRHPTMGEASGGILRSWTHATPALVTDAGWYADLPDTVARKISVENEIADIQAVLNELVSEPEPYRQMGLSGQARLAQLHAPDVYAETLARAFAETSRLMLRFSSVRLMRRAAARSSPAELGRARRQVDGLIPLDDAPSAWRL